MATKRGICEDCRARALADLMDRDLSDEDVKAIESVPGRFRIQSNRYQCHDCFARFLHPEAETATLDESEHEESW